MHNDMLLLRVECAKAHSEVASLLHAASIEAMRLVDAERSISFESGQQLPPATYAHAKELASQDARMSGMIGVLAVAILAEKYLECRQQWLINDLAAQQNNGNCK